MSKLSTGSLSIYLISIFYFSCFLQVLDYETKKSYTFKVDASNALPDPRFLHFGPFKDSATVKVNVLDIDEPPVFTKPSYIMDVYEDRPPGTFIGSVTAYDLDASSSAVRWVISQGIHSQKDPFSKKDPEELFALVV